MKSHSTIKKEKKSWIKTLRATKTINTEEKDLCKVQNDPE